MRSGDGTTVRQFMRRALTAVGVATHFEFIKRSPLHKLLWDHLCQISTRSIVDPLPPDVDAATVMTSEELRFADAALRYLPPGVDDWFDEDGRHEEAR